MLWDVHIRSSCSHTVIAAIKSPSITSLALFFPSLELNKTKKKQKKQHVLKT